MKLYSYFRSSAAYRVRIALNYKNLDYDIIPISLVDNVHTENAFKKINPQSRVPVLIDDDFTIGQSIAILEYLEEQYPDKPLLPDNIQQRAWVREIVNLIACDMHPLNNLSPWRYLSDVLRLPEEDKLKWYHHWLKQGFDALEKKLAASQYPGQFSLGDNLTLADVCIIPQVYNAKRFKFDMADYPNIMRINGHSLALNAIQKASPESQIDAPK